MKDRAPIFISAVTDELRTARDVVATTLRKLGHEVVYQPTFATLPGDLPSRLRELIQKSAAVIQLVGHRFGTELPRSQPPSRSLTKSQSSSEGDTHWMLLDSNPAGSRDPIPAQWNGVQSGSQTQRHL